MRTWLILQALGLIAATPAAAQLELQVVDASGPHTAPLSYDLGGTYANEPLQARFRLASSAGLAVTVSALSVAGVGFSLNAPTLPVSIEAQSTLSFTVVFRAAGLGSYSAVLRAHNTTIVLTAAVMPQLTWSLGSSALSNEVDFGVVQRGKSIRRRLTAVNGTPQLLTVPAIAITGSDFVMVGASPSGQVLSPQHSASFEIEFAPSATGSRAAVLTIGARTMTLTGTGLDPPLPHPLLSIELQNPASAQQGRLIVTYDRPAETTGSGTAALEFRGSADPTVAFAAGGRSLSFPVAPGDSQVALPFQTGTTAGTLVFTVNLGDATQTTSVSIPGAPPVLLSVQAARSSRSIEVRVTGYGNTHSISQVSFAFYSVGAIPITPANINVDVSAEFTRFFSESAVGGTFQLRAIFPVTGDVGQVEFMELTVADRAGTAGSGRIPVQ